MVILVVGQSGQIARALARTLPEAYHDLSAGSRVDFRFLNRQQADLSKPEGLRDVIAGERPALVINAAAYTAVDLAESESELAMRINAEAPAAMASACEELGVPLLHYSTDYVYSGLGENPWRETDQLAPLSSYGRTKAHGDEEVAKHCRKHIILRTSWVYDSSGKNFLLTMLRLGAEREVLRVVSDQVGSPTTALAIARATAQIARQVLDPEFKKWGIYHLVSQGTTSWHGFAQAIFDEARNLGFPLKVREVQPIATSEYPTPARRPLNSRLDTVKLRDVFGIELPSWRDSLRETLNTMAQAQAAERHA